MLRSWTGTRGVAEGATGPIDYHHPFLNQMLDYEKKGPVQNESPGEEKGLGLVACRARLCLLSTAKTPCEGCLEYRHVPSHTGYKTQDSPVHAIL